MITIVILFCFSSRRRHTRWPRDWSSDVCSSDLLLAAPLGFIGVYIRQKLEDSPVFQEMRSEERRVGKDCSYRAKLKPLEQKEALTRTDKSNQVEYGTQRREQQNT